MQTSLKTIIAKARLCLVIISLGVTMAACGSTPTTTNAGGGSTPTPPATATTAPTTAPSSSGNSVSLTNFAFGPKSLTVNVGTKVTWTNNDSVTHTVTADQGAFNSGPLAPGNSFSFPFSKPGTYSYHCSIHPSMTATIIVQ